MVPSSIRGRKIPGTSADAEVTLLSRTRRGNGSATDELVQPPKCSTRRRIPSVNQLPASSVIRRLSPISTTNVRVRLLLSVWANVERRGSVDP